MLVIFGIDAKIYKWTLLTFVRTLQGVANRLSTVATTALRIHQLTHIVAAVSDGVWSSIWTVLRAISIDNSRRKGDTQLMTISDEETV